MKTKLFLHLDEFKYLKVLSGGMKMSVESLQKEVLSLKREVDILKTILEENDDLSKEAKEALRHARRSPDSEYVELQ